MSLGDKNVIETGTSAFAENINVYQYGNSY